jgi:asparagine synthase (glutamine-hydrolysing)
MCGITGALALNHKALDIECAKPMVDILAHRGPDDAGYLFYHTGCRHERDITFSLHVTDEKFKHLAELLPPIESRAAQGELHSHDWICSWGTVVWPSWTSRPAGTNP